MKNLLVLLLLVCSLPAFTQNDEKEVKAVIDRMFEGFKKQDSLILKETLGESCFLKSIIKTKTGETKLQEEPMSAFIKAIGTKREGVTLDERLLSYDIKIDGAMAMAWTPYNLYVNEKFIHCGVDVFTLMKTDKGWKIIGIVDTRRKEGCNP